MLAHTHNNSDYKTIIQMMRLGCSTNAIDYWGMSPLMHAANHGNSLSVTTIKGIGTKAEVQCSKGQTALHYACRPAPSELAIFCGKDFLLENGNYHSTVDKNSNHVNCIRLICERHPELINIQDKSGNTALISSVGIPSHLEALLSYSPHINLRNDKGYSALEVAKKYGYTRSKEILTNYT